MILLSGCGGGADVDKSNPVGGSTPDPTPGIYTDVPRPLQSCASVPHATEELRNLNAFWRLNVQLCLAPFGTNNAYAQRSENRVYADQDWLDSIASRFGSFAATGILAHEWGHIAQGNTAPGVATELQADCLAGAHLRWAGLSEQILNQFVASNYYAGGGDHGTGQQRVNAAKRGYFGFDPTKAVLYTDLISTICPYSIGY
jgi:hypothetical protein